MENLSKRINVGPWINVGHEENNSQSYVTKIQKTWKYLYLGHGKDSKI